MTHIHMCRYTQWNRNCFLMHDARYATLCRLVMPSARLQSRPCIRDRSADLSSCTIHYKISHLSILPHVPDPLCYCCTYMYMLSFNPFLTYFNPFLTSFNLFCILFNLFHTSFNLFRTSLLRSMTMCLTLSWTKAVPQ